MCIVPEMLACCDSLLVSWIVLKVLLFPNRPSDILSLMGSHSGQYHAVVFESNGSYVGREVLCLMYMGLQLLWLGWTLVSALTATASEP